MIPALRRGLWNLWLKGKFDGKTSAYLRQLESWQWLASEEVTALQRAHMESLVAHAYRHVPYYTRVLGEAGVVRDDGKVHLENYHRVPLLEKITIRENSAALVSTDIGGRRWYRNASGGSTGEPVELVQDEVYQAWATATKHLFDRWSGYEVGEPKVVLWGSERDILVGRERARVRYGRLLRNEIWLNAFRMTASQMESHIELINRHRPVQILAYAESVYELARFIERKGLAVHAPRAVMTSAGTLFGYMRDTISRVFRAPVFNRYGSREVSDVACECESHMGLHVAAPIYYVEILNEDGTHAAPGEVGEVVVTLLTNYTMPLIRYRIGDMAAWAEETCRCGRGWPLLKEITGRVSDTFVNASGDRIHGEYFTHLMYYRPWVRKFQFIQEAIDEIRIRVVPTEDASARERVDQEIDQINRDIIRVMGHPCRISWQFEEDIASTPSGKFRYTISRVRE